MYEKDEKVKEPEGDYDPYQERVVDHPTTWVCPLSYTFSELIRTNTELFFFNRNMETLLHLLKGSLGTGILAMPNAFHNAGWALGLVGTIIIGIICTFCIHLLIKCEYELCKRRRIPALNYPATAEAGLQEGPTIFTKLAPISGWVDAESPVTHNRSIKFSIDLLIIYLIQACRQLFCVSLSTGHLLCVCGVRGVERERRRRRVLVRFGR